MENLRFGTGRLTTVRYFFIESRDPFESADSQYFSELVEGVSKKGNDTTVFLVQNGVLSARQGSKHNDLIRTLVQNKVRVLADRFSLRERAVRSLIEGVKVSDVDQLVELLFAPGTKAIWH